MPEAPAKQHLLFQTDQRNIVDSSHFRTSQPLQDNLRRLDGRCSSIAAAAVFSWSHAYTLQCTLRAAHAGCADASLALGPNGSRPGCESASRPGRTRETDYCQVHALPSLSRCDEEVNASNFLCFGYVAPDMHIQMPHHTHTRTHTPLHIMLYWH